MCKTYRTWWSSLYPTLLGVFFFFFKHYFEPVHRFHFLQTDENVIGTQFAFITCSAVGDTVPFQHKKTHPVSAVVVEYAKLFPKSTQHGASLCWYFRYEMDSATDKGPAIKHKGVGLL